MRLKRSIVAIGLGIAATLLIGEMALRMAGDALPVVSHWPTAESEVKYQQLTSGGLDPDVFVFGSSFIEAAVDPSRMTFLSTTYNLGMPFSTYDSMVWWLENIVGEEATPTVILIGVPTGILPDTRESWFVDAMSSALSRTEGGIAHGSALWRARGALGQLDRTMARQRLLASQPWNDFGHQTAYAEQSVPRSEWEERPLSLVTQQEDADLRRTIQVAREHAPNVVLTIEPTAGRHDSIEMMQRVEAVKLIGQDLGVPVWVPDKWFWLNDRFVDGAHFNKGAAIRFTAYVDRRLRELVATS